MCDLHIALWQEIGESENSRKKRGLINVAHTQARLMPSKGPEQDNYQATSNVMACENGSASGCNPASASEQSLKVDIYQTAQIQLFHPLTTWGSTNTPIWTWLTISWGAECMISMPNMFFDQRCQSTPDLNHYCFSTYNFPNFNTSSPYKYRNSFSK